jgi:hypothetical protein
MRTDSEIKKHVGDKLRWDPDVDATDVAVAVHCGVVTLTGFVRSYMQKTQAERDAKRVAGSWPSRTTACSSRGWQQATSSARSKTR